MIPSEGALKSAFDFYNQKYFDGKLPTPLFDLKNCPSNMLGYFEPNDLFKNKNGKVIKVGNPCGTLGITTRFSRAKKSILNTLLHEMVHMYVFFIIGWAPIQEHGPLFQKKAAELNADGWNIMAENELEDTDMENDGSETPFDTWDDMSFYQTNGNTSNNQTALNNIYNNLLIVQKLLNKLKS